MPEFKLPDGRVYDVSRPKNIYEDPPLLKLAGPFEQREVIARWQALLRSKGFEVKVDGVGGRSTYNATLVAARNVRAGFAGVVTPVLWDRVLAWKPGGSIGLGNSVLLGKLRVVDARDGRAGFEHHPTYRWRKRTVAQIEGICGHYTGGLGSFQADAHFHVTSDYLVTGGVESIAYGFGVDKDGTVYVFNDATDLTYHCDGGQNTRLAGIVFRGASEGPSSMQKRALKLLLQGMRQGAFEKYGWPALRGRFLTTHRHVKATTCPGEPGEDYYRLVADYLSIPFVANP